jgi:hypothetical protein
MITSDNRLEFGDNGTYIHQSADGVLDLVSDTEIEINATDVDMNGALDLTVSHDDNFAAKFKNTNAGGWGVQIQAGDGSGEYCLHIKDYDDTNVLHWVKGDGTAYFSNNVGIGDTSPDAHLDVEDLTIDTADHFYGLRTTYVKTAGATTGGDDYHPVKFYSEFDDADAQFGSYYGLWVTAFADACADGSGTVYGGKFDAQIDADADVDNLYGSYVLADVDAGTVDSSVYGQSIEVDIESGCTLSDHVLGLNLVMDCDTDPSGMVAALHMSTSENQDWVWIHYDTTVPSYRTKISAAGQIDAEGSINASQALDYAEYFESKDGSVIAVGSTVKLDGDKIVACEEGDTPLGVVRPVGSKTFCGGSQEFHWKDMCDKDDYGADVWEDYTLTKWSEEITLEEYIKRGKDETGGAMSGRVTDSKVEGSSAEYYKKEDEIPEGKEVGDVKVAAVADTYFREHKYHSDRLPDGVTAPDDAEVIEIASQRQKLNPDFDYSKEYSPREERDEWHIVGLLGQIPVTKGQPTGTWIKMKDVSDTVEMYFVK